MGTTGLLCVILLVARASNALPQYGGQSQVQEPVPVAPAVQPGQVATQLTEEIKEGLADFWWANQGVFDPNNHGGTVVVVQEESLPPSAANEFIPLPSDPFIPPPSGETFVPPPSVANTFVPTLSAECGEFEGCIYWKYCVDGVFSNSGIGLIAERTPPQVPETNKQKLCTGQGIGIGNICCRIPNELLLAQEGQANAGPYGSGGEEVIEVVSSGGVAGAVVPAQGQTGGFIGSPHSAGGVDPYAGGDAQITGVVGVGGDATGVDGTVQVVDQTGSASIGGPSIAVIGGVGGGDGYVEGSTGVVGAGVDTTGVVGVDVTGVVGAGVDATVQGVLPEVDATVQGGLTEVVAVVDTVCPPYTHDCVPYFQCVDGEINTSGVGLLDIRTPPRKECTNPEYPEVAGKCCRIPGATPPPTPAPVQTCPGTTLCVSSNLCNHNGNHNIANAGHQNIACYLDYVDETQYSTGVCCEPPPPAHLESCPGNKLCVAQGQCATHGSAGYDTCYIPGGTLVGECCDPPPTPSPTTAAPLVTCPGTEECVVHQQCSADGTIITDGAGLLNVRVLHRSCYLDESYTGVGVCCQPPTPAPLATCPGDRICSPEGSCTSGAAAGYDPCVFDAAVTGVCCDPPPPIPIVDVCPLDSVCIPEILCQGTILNAEEQFIPYGNAGVWTQCPLSGDVTTKGVCCSNPVPVTTSSPYVAAGQCGVRNVPLDLRSGPKLAKNEAHFGEFSWQTILFFTNFTYKCGASIIDDRWILTAAHCVNGYQYGDFKVRAGEWQVDKYDEPLKYQDLDIASISVHPGFNPANLHNDVALIELAKPLTFQYHINSVCLPGYNQIPEPGTRCFASGWGKDAFDGNFQPILKKIDVPFVDSTYCQDLLRKTRLGKYFQLDESFVCAGGEENKDACEGDGGGPLVCEDPATGRYFIVGITAWGIDCGVKDVPGVYANVPFFREWIDGIMNPLEQLQQQQEQQGAPSYGR